MPPHGCCFASWLVSTTDKSCSWSRPKPSTSSVCTVSNMFPDTTPTAQLNRPVSDEDRRALLSLLNKSNKQSALTWLLCPEPEYARCYVPTVRETVRCQESHIGCYCSSTGCHDAAHLCKSATDPDCWRAYSASEKQSTMTWTLNRPANSKYVRCSNQVCRRLPQAVCITV